MRPLLSKNHRYRWADDTETIEAARRLHGLRYGTAGYIKQEELDEQGRIREDPYWRYARYAVAENITTGSIDGTIRMIPHNPLGFPALTEFQLYENWRQFAPDLKADNAEELSGLAVDQKAVGEIFSLGPGLYRFVWQEVCRRKARIYWLASVDEGLYKIFVNVFHFCFRQIGETAVYLGSPTVPAVLDLRQQPDYMMARDPELVEYFLEGLEVEHRPGFTHPGDTASAVA